LIGEGAKWTKLASTVFQIGQGSKIGGGSIQSWTLFAKWPRDSNENEERNTLFAMFKKD
jgi:hypothetical protein